MTPEQRERKNAANRKWYAKNREAQRARRNAQNADNREQIRAYARAWKAANLEKTRAYQAAYRKRKRNELIERQRKWREVNKDKVKGWNAEYYRANREIVNAKCVLHNQGIHAGPVFYELAAVKVELQKLKKEIKHGHQQPG